MRTRLSPESRRALTKRPVPSTRSGAVTGALKVVQAALMHACVLEHAVGQAPATIWMHVDSDASVLAMPLTIAGVMQALPSAHKPAQVMGVVSATVRIQSPAELGLDDLATATRSSDVK